jgi:hypothetical protein
MITQLPPINKKMVSNRLDGQSPIDLSLQELKLWKPMEEFMVKKPLLTVKT